jgi:class 3 adenylate cyclase/tetratricopeptide (TPR) repeat protein
MTDGDHPRPPGPQSAFTPYVPRALLRHLAEAPHERVRHVDGTVVFADVSGFTRLSERLARKGRVGAEHLSDTISDCFSALLTVAYDNGGSLIKFGGDAMLLLFEGEGHLARACSSGTGMRRLLRRVGRIELDGARVQLRMSMGIHCAALHLFLVGDSHRELIMAGPGASEVVRMENAAGAGEIVISSAAAKQLPASCVGARKDRGRLLKRAPRAGAPPAEPDWRVPDETLAACLSTAVREHVGSGLRTPEHRTANVCFIHFGGIDEIIEREGAESAAAALEELVADVQRAADEHEVTFLGSDVDIDGGKLLLCSGAPRAVGDDEERLLLALREVLEAHRRLPVQVGAARGTVFAGDVGPWYRRTYAVMGDNTNLAARLMARAPAGEAYVNAKLLEGSGTRFHTTALEPFAVKGKARPVQAWSLGAVVDAPRVAAEDAEGVALIGRESERETLQQALVAAWEGHGRLVELAGEPGVGKSRLLQELHELAGDAEVLRATCETYRSATPYSVWRQLLRQLLEVRWEDPDSQVLARLGARVRSIDPALVAWVPLIAIPASVDVPPTQEVESIAPEFRTAALHEVTVRFLKACLTRPTLIEIENAHVMDEASAALLQAVARALPDLPWLVAISRRNAAEGFRAQPAEHVVELPLTRLERRDALLLAQATSERFPLPPHVLDAAVERSGGNPQFLRDLLAAARREGGEALPDSVESAAMARIDGLSTSDRELVRRSAVLGASFHPRELDDVLGDTPGPDASTWRRLAGTFAFDRDGHVRFRQGVLHEAAYAALPFRLRRSLHARAGDRLERELGSRADERAGPLSLHFLLAGDDARACRYARVAGEQAASRFAWADAAEHYRRALEAARRLDLSEDELVDLWESLGDARARTGELSAATSAYTAARRLLAKDRLREAQLFHLHALLSERSGRVIATVRWARRGLRTLDGLDGRPAEACRARLFAVLATARQRQGRHDDAIGLCRRAISAGEQSGERAAVAHACYILDWALVDAGRPDEAVHSQRALDIYARLGDLDRQAAVLNNLGAFAYHEGRWDEAVALYERAAVASARAGDVVNAAFGDCNVAEVRSDQGRLQEAEEALRRALLVWRGTEHDSGVAFAAAQLGRTVVRAGRVSEGLELLERGRALARELRVDAYSATIDSLLAEALVFAGRAEDALEMAERLLAKPEDARSLPLLHRVRGFALSQQGHPEAAAAAVEDSLLAARSLQMQYEVAMSLDALTHLAGEQAAHVAERDRIKARLDVVRFVQPPLRSVDLAA